MSNACPRKHAAPSDNYPHFDLVSSPLSRSLALDVKESEKQNPLTPILPKISRSTDAFLSTKKYQAITSTQQVDVIRPFKGLKYLGNTCYLNAALQLLFSVDRFLNDLEQFYKRKVVDSSNSSSEMPLTETCLSVAKSLNILPGGSSSISSCADPTLLKKVIDKVSDKFHGCEQRDSHEFATT